jgi:hypothetical protein
MLRSGHIEILIAAVVLVLALAFHAGQSHGQRTGEILDANGNTVEHFRPLRPYFPFFVWNANSSNAFST